MSIFDSKEGWKLYAAERSRGEEPTEERRVGDEVTTFRGERFRLVELHPPHKPSATGKVTVSSLHNDQACSTFYASVVGCRFVHEGDQP